MSRKVLFSIVERTNPKVGGLLKKDKLLNLKRSPSFLKRRRAFEEKVTGFLEKDGGSFSFNL
jgi:hypothetical protein